MTTGRDGKIKAIKLAGRDGGCTIYRPDGTVKFNKTDFHDGTGRLLFFPLAGRDGNYLFPRRDGTVNIFPPGGTGR